MYFTAPGTLNIGGTSQITANNMFAFGAQAIAVKGQSADSASAVGVILGNNSAFSTTGAKPVSIRNGAEVAAFTHTGSLLLTAGQKLDALTAGALNLGGTATTLVAASTVTNLGFANTSAGNSPTFTTTSAGEKITLYPAISGTSANFGIGVDNLTNFSLWLGVPTNLYKIDLVGGLTLFARFVNGNLTLNGSLTFGDATTQTTAATSASILPSQTGNSGKFLTTNGTVVSWGAAPVLLTSYWWSPVDVYKNCRNGSGVVAVPAAGAAQEKDSNKFATTRALTVTGVRFYWGGTGSDTVRALIYQGHTSGALLTTVDVSTSGAGEYTGTFATPQALGANYTFITAIHQTAGTKNDGTCTSGADNAFPPAASVIGASLTFRGTFFCSTTCASTDATVPSSATANLVPVAPVFTVP